MLKERCNSVMDACKTDQAVRQAMAAIIATFDKRVCSAEATAGRIAAGMFQTAHKAYINAQVRKDAQQVPVAGMCQLKL